MKRWIKIAFGILGPLLLGWGGLTFWVECARFAPARVLQAPKAAGRALVLYNPDPLYDLDRQVGEAFATALNTRGWEVKLSSHGSTGEGPDPGVDLCVLIANTYNWAPDRPTVRYIRQSAWLAGKPVVAITLGSGSTARSKRLLEEALQTRGAQLLASETYWLLRPNDESRMDEPNVQVALERAQGLARKVAAGMEGIKGDK